MVTKAIHPKSSCIVPYCPRTTRTFPLGHEWLCADHWKLVDTAFKRLRTRIIKRAKKRGRFQKWTHRDALELTLMGWWRRAKKQAIERAMGISA